MDTKPVDRQVAEQISQLEERLYEIELLIKYQNFSEEEELLSLIEERNKLENMVSILKK